MQKNFFLMFFDKTKPLLSGLVNEENNQASHILYYLSLFGCYLSGSSEAEIFKSHWLEIKEKLRSISDPMDFLNQTYMMEAHIEQALRNESIHKPGHPNNIGIYRFYEETFPGLYESAKEAQGKQYQAIDDWAKERQNYVQRLVDDNDFFNREVERDPGVWLMLD